MPRQPRALSVYLVAAGYRPPLPAPESFRRRFNDRLWIHIADPGAAEAVPTLLARLAESRGEEIDVMMSGYIDGARGSGARPVSLPRERAADVRAALAETPPGAALFLGFDLVPAFLYGLREAGTRIILVAGQNGTDISTAGRFLSRATLRLFDRVAATTETAARKLVRLGAQAGQVDVVGKLEVTAPPPPADHALLEALATTLSGRPAWLAAGLALDEARAVFDAQRQANGHSHRLMLVIAPATGEDPAAFAAVAEARGYTVARRSAGGEPTEDVQVLIADEPGEIGLWYRLSPITFMGRSLIAAGGDARPDAPAALGSAILYGPEVGPHREEFDRLASLGGARIVHNGKALGAAVSGLLAPDKTAAMAHAAWVETSRGAEATDRVVDLLMTALDEPEAL